MPSPQAVVTFVAVLFLMLVALHVPLAVPPLYAAPAAFILALGSGWVVNRNVPDDDDDVTEEGGSDERPVEAADSNRVANGEGERDSPDGAGTRPEDRGADY